MQLRILVDGSIDKDLFIGKGLQDRPTIAEKVIQTLSELHVPGRDLPFVDKIVFAGYDSFYRVDQPTLYGLLPRYNVVLLDYGDNDAILLNFIGEGTYPLIVAVNQGIAERISQNAKRYGINVDYPVINQR